jgi:hypothetical protein
MAMPGANGAIGKKPKESQKRRDHASGRAEIDQRRIGKKCDEGFRLGRHGQTRARQTGLSRLKTD